MTGVLGSDPPLGLPVWVPSCSALGPCMQLQSPGNNWHLSLSLNMCACVFRAVTTHSPSQIGNVSLKPFTF